MIWACLLFVCLLFVCLLDYVDILFDWIGDCFDLCLTDCGCCCLYKLRLGVVYC